MGLSNLEQTHGSSVPCLQALSGQAEQTPVSRTRQQCALPAGSVRTGRANPSIQNKTTVIRMRCSGCRTTLACMSPGGDASTPPSWFLTQR